VLLPETQVHPVSVGGGGSSLPPPGAQAEIKARAENTAMADTRVFGFLLFLEGVAFPMVIFLFRIKMKSWLFIVSFFHPLSQGESERLLPIWGDFFWRPESREFRYVQNQYTSLVNFGYSQVWVQEPGRLCDVR
jgi:hypothetical protein